jgi:Phage tail assembly chaperone protein, TAC
MVCAALEWTPAMFWQATPREVLAIIDAREEMAEREC